MTEFIDTRKLVAVVLTRWWILLGFAVLAALAGYLYSTQQTPIYASTTTLSVSSTMQATELNPDDFEITDELALAYADIARRQPVLQGVIDTLDLGMTWQELKSQIRAEPVPNTPFIEIVAEATLPQTASAIANEVARQLLMRSPAASENQQVQEDRAFVQQRLANIRANIVEGQERLSAIEGQIANARMLPAVQLSGFQEELRILDNLIANWDATYSRLLLSLNTAQITNSLSVFELAQPNVKPIRPQIMMTTLLALIVGVVLGLGLIFLLEYLNTTLRTAEEAAQFLHLPSLGTISHIAHTKDKLQDALLQHQEVFSPALEEYRLLYSKLNFLFTDQAHKVILVTSSSAGEGKSVTVANLAILMAQAGHQTIILDANLRAPMQHILFNLREAGGLTNLLSTPHLKLDGKLKQTRVNNLSVVTCGDLHLARPEQLSSDRTALLVAALYNLADIVLIDCPETVTVADVPLLVQQVDGVLLVIGSGQTRRDKALQAVDNLQQANAHILGVVVNNARSGRKTFAPSASTVQPPVNTVVKQSAHLKM